MCQCKNSVKYIVQKYMNKEKLNFIFLSAFNLRDTSEHQSAIRYNFTQEILWNT